MQLPLLLALVGIIFRLSVAAPSENCTFDSISPSSTLTWCLCGNGFFCAKLDVPLDYKNPANGRASVPLVKYPAKVDSSDGPYQGQILLNPGGPGASGISEALTEGILIQAVLGTNWDIVGFDTRGMWLSRPLANCSSNASLHLNNTLRAKSVPRVSDEFYTSVIDFTKELGQQCQKIIGGPTSIGQYMSTAINARDMLSITNAFAETEDGKRAAKPPHLLNYYGISYGTFLGQTFASMFPESVGNVVLDGVVSPEGYLAGGFANAVLHLDGAIASWFIYCNKAGPSICSYYNGSTPKDIYMRFKRSFAQLDPRRAEAKHWSNATYLEDALLVLKDGLLTYADAPLSYYSVLPTVFESLEAALSSQNLSSWITQMQKIFGEPGITGYETTNPQWSLGTLCSDQNNILYNKTLKDLRAPIKELEQQSIIGEIWTHQELGCTGWSIKASEIYEGPFGGDTATPILFIDNTYDPVTPIENGITSTPNYKYAQRITVDGVGHTVIATQNTCGFAKLRAYFQTGVLPGNDSYCPLEQGPFGIVLNGTLKENIQHAGLSDLVH